MAKVFIDTNILVYSIYGDARQKEKVNVALTDAGGQLVLSMQVLKEFTNVCLKKRLHKTVDELTGNILKTAQTFSVSEITVHTLTEAISIHQQYGFSFYDSLIIATALEQECKTLYSQDLQHGQTIKRKLKIVNPFV
ncbi:MAG: PIN domain-containing protein [Chitinophagales bacterium]|nr:PIN domain-containing protein [Chitinophagales bacterium]